MGDVHRKGYSTSGGNDRTSQLRPFRVNVPQADLDDLRDRLTRTRWADELGPVVPVPGSLGEPGWEYGVPLSWLTRLVAYWRGGYDWRAWEAKLNAWPQFTTEVDGQDIHFIHAKSPEPNALPLILTHGWPGSVAEFLDVVGPLTDPRSNGGDPADAFTVVVPSLPGFGFGGPTTYHGWGTARTAKAWAELMIRLGYERYGAAGNDAGSMISPEIGRVAPQQVAGVFVTQLYSFPSGDPAEFAGMTDDELAGMQTLKWFWENKGAFNTLQSQQPQTLAHAITDSPTGLLAWNGQLFGTELDDDFVLTNIAIYWFTHTVASAMRFYYENDKAAKVTGGPTTVPTGLSAAGSGDFKSIRRFAERDHANITLWRVNDDVIGHYTAHQAPHVFVRDICDFYRDLR